jgi:hypothetical protein
MFIPINRPVVEVRVTTQEPIVAEDERVVERTEVEAEVPDSVKVVA